MAGQIINRGERTWLVRVFLGRDPHTGRRRYHNHTVKGTKKDAQRYLNGVLREIDMGSFVEPSKMTLNGYLDHWLETATRPRVREQTFYSYESLLEKHVRPKLGDRRLSLLTPMEIQDLYTRILEAGLSARTVRYTHAVLSSALKQAVKWRMLSQNPASYVDLPRLKKTEMKAFSPEEAECFLKAASADRWGTLFEFALTTGMRPGEYLALQWKDVDLKAGTATVRRALVRRKNGSWMFEEPKTDRSRRTIPLPPSVVASLVQHKRQQAEKRLAKGPAYKNRDLVFATSTGQPLDQINLSRRHFKPTLKVAGLSTTFRIYDLRHSCATLLLAAGENPKVVSERLGHASVALTLDIYSHVLPSMQQQAAERLEAILFRR
jgi:integrase